MVCLLLLFFLCSDDHRELHVRTHSFPTRRSSDLIKQSGADILRLWVVSSDYSDDLSVGKGIIQAQSDAYRRLRNTLRYLLGNLSGFVESERLPYAEMPELERWVLHRLAELGKVVQESCLEYDFHRMRSEEHTSELQSLLRI